LRKFQQIDFWWLGRQAGTIALQFGSQLGNFGSQVINGGLQVGGWGIGGIAGRGSTLGS